MGFSHKSLLYWITAVWVRFCCKNCCIMDLLFCIFWLKIPYNHFYKFTGSQKALLLSNLYQKVVMKRKTRKPIEPIAQINTLNHYFKQGNCDFKEQAKPRIFLPNEESIMNASTNGSHRPPSPREEYYENEDSDNQNAIPFQALEQHKKNQLEVENGDSRFSYTKQMPNLNKIRLVEEDENTTKGFKKCMKEAVINQVSNTQPFRPKPKQQFKKDSQFENIKAKQQKQAEPDKKLEVKMNKKVEEILKKEPLRNRFSELLSDDLKYSIGYSHTRLLKLLRAIDCTVDFLRINRQTQTKGHFFSQLRTMLYQNNCTQFSYKSLQQLIFIDTNLFQIQWVNNEKIKKYDLSLTAPIIKSEDSRIAETRKKIVGFLLIKEAEYLIAKNMKKQIDKWSDGFDPNSIEIPTKDLPPHPNMRNAEIGQLSGAQIDAVPNPILRNIIKSVKQQSDARSLCSDDVTSLIFGKKNNDAIKDRLYEAIRMKQQRNLALAQAPAQIIDKQMGLDICTEIQTVYMSKGVINMFKGTLLDTLNKRLRFKMAPISQCLEFMISQKDIEFLKEVPLSSSQTVVVQISKEKFRLMRERIQSSL